MIELYTSPFDVKKQLKKEKIINKALELFSLKKIVSRHFF